MRLLRPAVSLCIGGAWLVFTAAPATATVDFKPATTVPTGGQPRSVAVADFNGDGAADLAVASLADGTVHVRLGDGHGAFGPDTTIAAGAGATDVVVPDLDGDGSRDLVTANSFDATVSALLGDGSGGFGGGPFGAGAFSPQRVAVGDVTGSSAPDLVVSALGPDRLALLAGDGTGQLGPPTTLPLAGSTPLGVAVSDLNGDSRGDVVVVNSGSQNFGVLLANGAGGFASPVTYRTGGLDPTEVAAADLNEDSHPDIAVGNSGAGPGTIGVRLGHGDGTFGSVAAVPTGGRNPSSVAVADFDGDGDPDLATPNLSSDNVSVLAGDGQGGFDAPASFGVGGAPIAAAVGDFDRNCAPDLAVSSLAGRSVSILINKATGAEPLVLHLPDPITVDATGPAGALVTYEVSATGGCGPAPTAQCSPASGTTFPIGVDTVHCAAGPSGGETQGEFTVTVRGAAEQLQDLEIDLSIAGLPSGTQQSLLAKLDAAFASVGGGSIGAACGQLGAFAAAVGAQTGKKLTAVQAAELLAASSRISAVLACG